ncbi:hypothetical protein E2C01_087116 [Portunus trituberculatus]|uniref:Uncharacterized protein n=1 Tax=Portunus trituberculatus TaxID=210409 RepID=A0A5B7JBJ4_PORTR|nr:hypothetical protein [Portunus trituberculatus]
MVKRLTSPQLSEGRTWTVKLRAWAMAVIMR